MSLRAETQRDMRSAKRSDAWSGAHFAEQRSGPCEAFPVQPAPTLRAVWELQTVVAPRKALSITATIV